MSVRLDPVDQVDIDEANALLVLLPPDLQMLMRAALIDAFAMGMRHGIDYAHDPGRRYVNPYRAG